MKKEWLELIRDNCGDIWIAAKDSSMLYTTGGFCSIGQLVVRGELPNDDPGDEEDDEVLGVAPYDILE